MVKPLLNPAISWRETFGPEDDGRVAAFTAATLADTLGPARPQCQRMFFVVPMPKPYEENELQMLMAVERKVGRPPRTIRLPGGLPCYIADDLEQFLALLPHAFRLGPPEITLLVADCHFPATAPEAEIGTFIRELLRGPPSGCYAAGMHFDSGDLMELFRAASD